MNFFGYRLLCNNGSNCCSYSTILQPLQSCVKYFSVSTWLLNVNEAHKQKLYTQQHFTSESEVGATIQDLFKISPIDCQKLLQSNIFKKGSAECIISTAEYLHDRGIAGDQILRIPWVLMETTKSLRDKLSLLQGGDNLFAAPADGIGYCRYNIPIINKYLLKFILEKGKLPNYRNRIYFISDQLDISVPKLTDAVSRVSNPSFCYTPLTRVKEYIRLLQQYNIPREYILYDPWMFVRNIDVSTQRFKKIHETCPEVTFRPWAARCSPVQLDRLLSYRASLANDRDLLAGGSLAELLANTLQCPVAEVEFRLSAHKFNVRPTKMVTVCKLLLEHGYTSQQILKSLYVVESSIEKLKRRLRLLEENGVDASALFWLSKPEATFSTFLKKIKSRQQLVQPPTDGRSDGGEHK